LASKEPHEGHKRCADFAHLYVRFAWIVVGGPMIVLPILAHVVRSLPHPAIVARPTKELRSASGQFNEAGGGKWPMCEIRRPSARVVFQKRKDSDGRHTMEFRFDLLIH
jgi:hypothetical protein